MFSTTTPKPDPSPADLEAFAADFPSSTESERLRFLKAHKTVALARKAIGEYLEWRSTHNFPEDPKSSGNDEEDWNYAAEMALKCDASNERTSLPQMAFCLRDEEGKPMLSKKGHVVLHVIPARIESTWASNEVYALAQAFYCDRLMTRHGDMRVSICMDCRGGHGWPNPLARTMIGFIRQTTNLLFAHFPERLGETIMFPLYTAAVYVWKILISPLLEKELVARTFPLAGDDGREVPPPKEMFNYIHETDVERMEQQRASYFNKK